MAQVGIISKAQKYSRQNSAYCKKNPEIFFKLEKFFLQRKHQKKLTLEIINFQKSVWCSILHALSHAQAHFRSCSYMNQATCLQSHHETLD